MGLVEDQVGQLEELRGELRRRDALQALGEDAPWPTERSLVLARDLAVELGNPAVGSMNALLWTVDGPVEDQIELLGPDIGELSGSQPFAQIILVGLDPKDPRKNNSSTEGVTVPFQARSEEGAWPSHVTDEGRSKTWHRGGRMPSYSYAGPKSNHEDDDDQYQLLLELYQALDDLTLQGLTTRATAGHRDVWYRLSREAQSQGFSLAHVGAELLRRLRAIDQVITARVLFVTEQASVRAFEKLARQSQRINAALIKRHEEVEHECDLCELSDVCVEGLLR